MALTVEVTKRNIRKIADKLYTVEMSMKLLDDTIEVVNKTYSMRIIEGTKIDINVFTQMMQKDIDIYRKEQSVLTVAEFDTDVTNIKNALVLTDVAVK